MSEFQGEKYKSCGNCGRWDAASSEYVEGLENQVAELKEQVVATQQTNRALTQQLTNIRAAENKHRRLAHDYLPYEEDER